MEKKASEKVFIIAEAGVNHNGSVDMAMQLVDIAYEAGADAVKFQTFKADAVISSVAPKADYQKSTTGDAGNQLEMVRKLELSIDDHYKIFEHCQSLNMLFLSTPFDPGSADFLADKMKVPLIKIPSGEVTNAPFLLHIAKLQRPVILSTGMSTLAEVEVALGVLAFGYLDADKKPCDAVFQDAFISQEGQAMLKDNVSLLHCTTEYPAPYDQVNLQALNTLSLSFGLPVGLSDHTMGIAIPIAAVALGASIIEKHFTLDKNQHGPDHLASLEPDELSRMISAIRQTEEAIGDGRKIPGLSEIKNKDIARRSLVAACNVKKNDIWTAANLTCKRPGNGVSPMRYWDFLGRQANKSYVQDELILPEPPE